MLVPLPPPDTGDDSLDRRTSGVQAKITWTEVAALTLVVLFAGFLVVWGVAPDHAVPTAVATVVGTKVMVRPPHAVAEGLQLMREILRQLRSGR